MITCASVIIVHYGYMYICICVCIHSDCVYYMNVSVREKGAACVGGRLSPRLIHQTYEYLTSMTIIITICLALRKRTSRSAAHPLLCVVASPIVGQVLSTSPPMSPMTGQVGHTIYLHIYPLCM